MRWGVWGIALLTAGLLACTEGGEGCEETLYFLQRRTTQCTEEHTVYRAGDVAETVYYLDFVEGGCRPQAVNGSTMYRFLGEEVPPEEMVAFE